MYAIRSYYDQWVADNVGILKLNNHGLLAVSDGSRTSLAGVHAAGALVNGGASVARCVAEGLAAAADIDATLQR